MRTLCLSELVQDWLNTMYGSCYGNKGRLIISKGINHDQWITSNGDVWLPHVLRCQVVKIIIIINLKKKKKKSLSDESELLLEILGSGFVAGFVLPNHGALPDAMLVLGAH